MTSRRTARHGAPTFRQAARDQDRRHQSEAVYGDPHSAMIREFFLGFIKLHIMHHAAEEPVYGLALITELRRHGYELSPGKMYPVLHQLERAAYLRRIDRVVGGKVRKYYAITRRGLTALADARSKIGELVGELLEANLTSRAAAAPLPGRSRIPRRRRGPLA